MKIINMRYILLFLLFGTKFFLHTGETIRKGGKLAKWKAFRNVKCSFSGGLLKAESVQNDPQIISPEIHADVSEIDRISITCRAEKLNDQI